MNTQQSFIKKRGQFILSFLLICSLHSFTPVVFAVSDDGQEVEEAGGFGFFKMLEDTTTAIANNPAVQAAGKAIGDGVRAVANVAAERLESAKQSYDAKVQKIHDEYNAQKAIIDEAHIPKKERGGEWQAERDRNWNLKILTQKQQEDRLEAIEKIRDKALDEAEAVLKEETKATNEFKKNVDQFMINAGNEAIQSPRLLAQAKIAAVQQGRTEKENHRATLAEWSKRLKDPVMIRNVVLGLGASALLVSAAYYGTKVGSKYLEALIGKPQLVRETSRVSFYQSLFGEKPKSRMGEFVVHEYQKAQLMEIAEAAKQASSRGDELSNVLLYGPPGTGKTMFAKALAHYAGLEYAMMSGSDFSQFQEGEDIVQLHKLFDWAEASKKGLLVFVDEADAFLLERGLASTSEQSKKLTNAFLSRVEKPSSLKIMFVFATNHPKTIDKAVFSRINDKVEFVLPAAQERLDILTMYMKQYVTGKNIVIAPELQANMNKLVEKLKGASGRDIQQCCVNFVRAARTANTAIVTLPIAEKVVERYMNEIAKQQAREFSAEPMAARG